MIMFLFSLCLDLTKIEGDKLMKIRINRIVDIGENIIGTF